MKNSLKFLSGSLLLLSFIYISSSLQGTGNAAAQHISQVPKPLATESFNLDEEMEVGLEINARSTAASWARKDAEAAAVLISVDGVYNQDVLLWAGDEMFPYRVALGRFPKGKHTVSVALNFARSAPQAGRAEVKSLQTLLLANSRRSNSSAAVYEEQLALTHSPILYARANTIDHFTDLPLLMYYEILREAGDDLIVRYTVIFTNEDGGTQTAALMARWGRGTDIEWVYQFRVHNQKIVEETYQGVEHETKFFKGSRAAGYHPLLAVASDNNNFSDLACSAVRFALLPIRARLETATRESVMDAYPQTYRVMTEELLREKRISSAPSDINTIADPREYLYIEATSEQEGTALAFDVKIADQPRIFSSDMNEPRLRIDRSGYFRTAVRLPKGVSPAAIETITARCNASSKAASARRCEHLKVARALMLDQNYIPRTLPLQQQPESSLAPDEIKVFQLAQR
jgi:hypothetical protein